MDEFDRIRDVIYDLRKFIDEVKAENWNAEKIYMIQDRIVDLETSLEIIENGNS